MDLRRIFLVSDNTLLLEYQTEPVPSDHGSWRRYGSGGPKTLGNFGGAATIKRGFKGQACPEVFDMGRLMADILLAKVFPSLTVRCRLSTSRTSFPVPFRRYNKSHTFGPINRMDGTAEKPTYNVRNLPIVFG